MKGWLIGKDSDAGRDLGQEEKEMTEDEMAGWHHWLNGRESEWTPGVGDGQGGLASCDSWGCKESDTTERLNWTDWCWKFCLWNLARSTGTCKLEWHHSGRQSVICCQDSLDQLLMTQWDLSDTPVIYFVCSNKKNTVSKKYEVIMKKCKRHAIGTLGELKTE